MAMCYNCKEIFYGNYCDKCGWKAKYKCWNCGEHIDPENEKKCYSCGWFECPSCSECGCNEDRPPSNEEEYYG